MSLMKKRQEQPKIYFVIIIIALLVSALAAILIPVPRKFKWLLFYMLWVVLAFVGIIVYSRIQSGKNKGWRK